MFRQTVARPASDTDKSFNADRLFTSGPAQIMTLMNHAWTQRVGRPGVFRQAWEEDPVAVMANPGAYLTGFRPPITPTTPLAYPHAIEAFCLENTRVVEIFRRVIGHFVHGEQLAVPPDKLIAANTTDIVSWLRTTEMLFFSPLPALVPYAVTSEIRNDPDIVRRNFYYRFFGADLLHPAPANGNIEQMKPAASNRDFFPTFERLLAEVWRGIVLLDIMADRRLGGNLQREEFYSTAMLSWLHTALLWNSPIVTALKAEADHPADRLARIGERVGLKPHVHSAAYIQMAPLAGFLMDCIATGTLNDASAAPFYYMPGAGPFTNFSEVMTQLITLYMRATGRDIKAAAVTVTQRA